MANIDEDILITCADENRRGGIKRVFLANADKIASFTAHGSNHSYTAVTMDSTADEWFEVQGEFEKKVLTGEGSIENGSSVSTNTLTIHVPKIEKVKGNAIQELFNSCKVVAIVETYTDTGTYKQALVIGYDDILGLDAGLRMSVNQSVEGELQGLNGYDLTFTGKSAEVFREFVGAITSNSSGNVSFGS